MHIKSEKQVVSIPKTETHAAYDAKKIILYPRKKLGRGIVEGEIISILSKTGVTRSYKVIEFHDDLVRLDGNHPLASRELFFDLEAVKTGTVSSLNSEHILN